MSGVDASGNAYGSHGTACAAIALGNINDVCSSGVAPGASFAGCPILADTVVTDSFAQAVPTSNEEILTFALERNHISSNSWGIDGCPTLERRRGRRAEMPEHEAITRRLQAVSYTHLTLPTICSV